MKNITNNFKSALISDARVFDKQLTQNGERIELNNIVYRSEASLLKSLMKELEIDSLTPLEKDSIVNYKIGLKVNDEFEYINYGNFVVYSVEKQEDTQSYKIICYDKMLYSMKKNENLGITYPITIREYIKAICNKMGVAFANENNTFNNYDKVIAQELYFGQDYTYRDILDELAQATGSIIEINENDELELKYVEETNETFNEDYLKNYDINFGEKYGPINSIVLSRSAESDNVYLRDEESVAIDGLCEIKIIDNQIMNFNDRSDYLQGIFDSLNGVEFYTNNFQSYGFLFLEVNDKYNVEVGDVTYPCLMLENEIRTIDGVEEYVNTVKPEQTQTDYTKADKTDRRINQAYLLVDKQNKKINAVVETTETIQEEIVTNGSTSGSMIKVEDGANEPLISFEIEGKSVQHTRSGINQLKSFEEGERSYFSSLTNIVNSDTNYYKATPLEDNWLRIECNRTGGSAGQQYINCMIGKDKIPNLKANTNYTFVVEFRNVSITQMNSLLYIGNSHETSTDDDAFETLLDFGSGNIIEGAIYKELVRTSSNITGTTPLRNFHTTVLGDKFSYDMRLSILEGDYTNSEYTYEEFGVSPSPDYPSEIKSVGYENLYEGSQDWSGTWTNNGAWTTDNDTYNDLIVKKRYGAWSGIYKDINIVAGKTYTFSVYLKADEVRNVAIYISGGTSGVDTYRNITASTEWERYSLTFVATNSGTTHPRLEAITTINNSYVYICGYQLEEGNLRPYIPYGKYGIEVETTGKNKFDYTKISSAGNWASYPDAKFLEFNLKPNTYYTLSSDVPLGSSTLIYFNGDKSAQNGVWLNNPKTFISDEEGYLFVAIFTNRDYYNDVVNGKYYIQLEEGIATEYKPYQKNTLVIELNERLRSLPNGVKDVAYIKNNVLYVERKIGSVVLNGSESYTDVYVRTNTIRCLYALSGVSYTSISSYLKENKLIYNKDYIGQLLENNYLVLSFPINVVGNSIDLLKTWLSTHNTQVDYELAEPYTENLGEIEMPSTYQGTTYIYANDELEPTIEVEYVRDTNLSSYVQGQINNVVEIQQRKNTEFAQTNESISARVTDVSTALGTINDTLSTINETILKQTADQFQMLFNQTQVKGLIDDLNSLVNSNNTTLETLQAYINYGSTTYEGELTPYILLGASESPVKLMLIKNRIRFMNGETEMAFISNNALNINEMITKKINTGHWLTYEDSQYNLNTKWVNQ